MPSQVVFDIFALPGVTPQYEHSITGGNSILAANAKSISVSLKVGQVTKIAADATGVNKASPGTLTGGDMNAEGTDWRYSSQQRDLLGGIRPTAGAMPVIWGEGMTQGLRLGEAVNPRVWDKTYTGRSGICMHNGAAAYDAVLLHELLHMCDLVHVPDATNVMHATMTGVSDQNKLTDAQKQTLANASF